MMIDSQANDLNPITDINVVAELIVVDDRDADTSRLSLEGIIIIFIAIMIRPTQTTR